MTKFKVVFSIDPTGFDQDITEDIFIPANTCLYCSHDLRLGINRLHKEVIKALEYKGYDLGRHFYLLKMYSY